MQIVIQNIMQVIHCTAACTIAAVAASPETMLYAAHKVVPTPAHLPRQAQDTHVSLSAYQEHIWCHAFILQNCKIVKCCFWDERPTAPADLIPLFPGLESDGLTGTSSSSSSSSSSASAAFCTSRATPCVNTQQLLK